MKLFHLHLHCTHQKRLPPVVATATEATACTGHKSCIERSCCCKQLCFSKALLPTVIAATKTSKISTLQPHRNTHTWCLLLAVWHRPDLVITQGTTARRAAAVQNLTYKKSAVCLFACNRWPQHCWPYAIGATNSTGDAMLLNARNPRETRSCLELTRCHLCSGTCCFAPCQHD